ncbi:hypothetical protein ACLIA0_13085 [Bacillaceae bacterium W0354]
MELTTPHWLYLVGTLLIILTMVFRQNVVVPALLSIFIIAWSFTGSILEAIQAVFNANLTAANELFNIFLIIAVMTALLRSIKTIGADEQMVKPFQKVMKNGPLAFWSLVVITYFLSLFFWPAPAVPLIGALLIPVAIKAGLSPLGAAIAISLAGHGMALSSDFVLKVAPELTASSSEQLEASTIGEQTLILSLIAGAVSLIISYFMVRKSMKKPSEQNLKDWENSGDDDLNINTDDTEVKKGIHSPIFAILVPTIFLIIVTYVVLATFTTAVPPIEDGAGSALVGGTAFILIIIMSVFRNYKKSLQEVSDHIISGFVYAFKVMGLVIPVAAFFFIGNGELAGQIFGTSQDATPSFLFDLVQEGQAYIPDNAFFTAFGLLILGMVSGLDGSGFSGLPLIGSLSGSLAVTGVDPTTLASIGQVGAIWVGGGTLVAWSPIIAIAGFAKISVIDLVRKSFLPVVIGLIISTIFALIIF